MNKCVTTCVQNCFIMASVEMKSKKRKINFLSHRLMSVFLRWFTMGGEDLWVMEKSQESTDGKYGKDFALKVRSGK